VPTKKKFVLELTNDEAHLLLSFAEHGKYAFGLGGTSAKENAYPRALELMVMELSHYNILEHKAGLSSLNNMLNALSDMLEY